MKNSVIKFFLDAAISGLNWIKKQMLLEGKKDERL